MIGVPQVVYDTSVPVTALDTQSCLCLCIVTACRLDQHHVLLNIMPDFKGKLKEEVIFKDKLPSFLKNLNKFWGLFVRN